MVLRPRTYMQGRPFPAPAISDMGLRNEFVYLSLFAVAIVFSIKSNLRGKYGLIPCLVFLVISRWGLESQGGQLFFVELPVMILAAVIAIRGLIRGSS